MITAWLPSVYCTMVKYETCTSSRNLELQHNHFVCLWLSSPLLDLGGFFSFLICRTPWTQDQHITRPLPTRRTTQAQNKRVQTFMP
jgi:hypothetical protein